jgi:hypothetical protein
VNRALWLLALALPLAGQPKLLINAKPDVQSASSGLDAAFRALLPAQPQPAWIGYSVPSVRTYGLGCEYVSRGDGPGAGVMHLEPPDHAIILFRVLGNAVERIRAMSPDCEIDAGDVPFHWLNDVQPAQSIALLSTFVDSSSRLSSSALNAIAMHADPAADTALDRFLAPAQPRDLRLRTVSAMRTRGQHGVDTLKNLIATDPDQRIRERAVNTLGSLPDGQGVPLLIDLAKTGSTPDLRKQAMRSLQNTRDPRALAFFEQVLK